MDWHGWAIFGLVATTLLTATLTFVQVIGRSRLDLPLMLGTMFVADLDRARAVGFVVHLSFGQVFALFYAAGFDALGQAGWWRGALFGAIHAAVALTVLVPLLPGIHPRMASERAGPAAKPTLEPPGPLALSYGVATPAFTLAAHVVYGALLGLALHP